MSAARGDKYRCISERETPYGYWWRYTHFQDEPDDTLKAAAEDGFEQSLVASIREEGWRALGISAPLMPGDAGEQRRILPRTAKKPPLHPPPEL
jgi:hypothetical protein